MTSVGACETAPILLNSKPGGLGNSSGLLKRYLMDTVASTTAGYFPALEKLPHRNDDGMSVGQVYVPWWGLDEQKELGFARGYHIEIFGGQRMPSMDLMGEYADNCGTTPFGTSLRDEVR